MVSNLVRVTWVEQILTGESSHVNNPMGRVDVNRADLAHAIIENGGATGVSLAQVERIIDEVFSAMASKLVDAGDMKIRNFGTFEIVERPSRPRRNLVTGELEMADPVSMVRFHASQSLKDRINKRARRTRR